MDEDSEVFQQLGNTPTFVADNYFYQVNSANASVVPGVVYQPNSHSISVRIRPGSFPPSWN